jgi:putative ABC transport system permease protein
MTRTPSWRRYLRFWGPNVAEDVDDELHFHIEMLAEHCRARGMAPDDARREALARFGDVDRVGQTLRAHDYQHVRAYRRREIMGDLIRDLRIAFRGFRRAPVFAAVAIMTLALGIGANTAIFSVVDAVLLRPLPYHESERLVSVWGSTQGEVVRVGELSRSFRSLGAHRAESMSLSGEGDPERIDGASVTAGLFTTLGVGAALGRTFVVEENEERGARVVVISDELWRRRFGGDSLVLGRPLTINGSARTVVGVMPAGFEFPSRGTELWVPLIFERSNAGQFWGWGGNRITARLAPGVSAAQAQEEVREIARRIRTENPVWDPGEEYGRDARVVPLLENAVGGVKPTLLLLLAVVGCVLLIACANVANLLLVRAAGRRKELAIRSALGGGRSRLIRQLLTESLVLSSAGALGGLVLAWAGLRVLVAMIPPDMPRMGEVAIDGRVLAFTGVLALVTGVAFGLLPAMRSIGACLLGALNESGRSASRGAGHNRLSNGLVVAEIAVSVVLVASAGLLVRSFVELTRVHPGFSPGQVVSARISAPERAYSEPDRVRGFYGGLLERVAGLPGVTHVGAVNPLPLRDPLNGMAIRVQGQFEDMRNALPSADHYQMVTPGYLRTMGIALVSGRDITDADRAGTEPVILVSESIAREFWPGESAIGKKLGYPWPSPWLTIVGVVGDVKHDSLSSTRTLALYRPFAQAPIPSMTVVMRTTADPGVIANLLRATVRELDPNVPVSDVAAMDHVLSSAMARPRFAAILLTAFSAVAMMLGAIGIYGVIAYAVSQRTREIGVRMALGATPRDALWMVLRRGVWLTIAGLVVGTVAALGATRLLGGLLYGVSPTDPVTFAGVAVMLAGVAVLACYIPARRATRVDPAMALRAE